MTTPPTSPASPAPASRAGLIEAFARHPVACNLLMAIMLLVGAAALTRLNTQTYPDIDINTITVRMVWSGATPEDVEAAITAPLERELLNLGGLKEVTSWSHHGAARLSLTYDEGADMAFALEEVKERIASIRNLPASAEEPVISRVVRYEPVARLLVTGDDGRLVTLGDVASVERRARGSEALIFHEGRPAVNLRLRRAGLGA